MWDYLKSKYEGKSVFVTGHTGFKGAWLTETLHLLGAKITGYALPPYYDNNLYELLQLRGKCDSYLADIQYYGPLQEKLKAANPHYVFHLAAQPLVRLSYREPIETYGANVMGTVNIMEAIRQYGKPTVGVMITTDKVYENNEHGDPFKEEDKLAGYDPYSASKAACEIVIDSYVKSYFNKEKYAEHKVAISSCRAGNVIGGGDWATDRLLPDIINSIKGDKPIHIRNPHAVRPWQHVLESVFGYLLLGAKMHDDPHKYASAYNIGPEDADILKVSEVVEKAIAIWGSGSFTTAKNVDAPHEAGILKLDCSKLKSVVGWKPVFDVDEAVKKTIEWYKANAQNPMKSQEVTDAQIMEYGARFVLG